MTWYNGSADLPWFVHCLYFGTGLYIVPSFTVVSGLLLFPLYLLVLRTGFQRRRQNKRRSVSHADFFTYNAFVLELVSYGGYVAFSVVSFQLNFDLIEVVFFVLYFLYPAWLSLHVLTCVERYLAVLYPVVYLVLKKRKWLWIRNVVVFITWLCTLVWAVMLWVTKNTDIPFLTMLGTAASIISVCSVQVLHTLRNPSPGEGRRVSQSKRKAFCTMLAILLAVLLWLAGETSSTVFDDTNLLDADAMCRFQLSSCWFELPCSLVLPLLFLHRAGKLPKWKGKNLKSPGSELRG